MYDELYQYLIQQKQLNVPGIGTFLLQRKPAGADFLNKNILPPSYEISLQQTTASASRKFFTWLAYTLSISDGEAVIRFNDFAFDLKKEIVADSEIKWNGVGTLMKGSAGAIKFIPSSEKFFIGEPVHAEKLIREHAEHIMLVGETERTSVEMTEFFNKQENKKSSWWVNALGIVMLTTMFIGWYFSEYGLKVSSTANRQQLVPKKTGATYSNLR